MLDKLISHEADLFFSINGTRNCFLDSMMWLYSGMKIWMPLAVFFIFMLMYKKNWQKWLPGDCNLNCVSKEKIIIFTNTVFL